jgi:hypothetical protein
MKKLILMLIPVAILLACEPIFPPTPGGGGVTNPSNKNKGALIKKSTKYNMGPGNIPSIVWSDNYRLEYNSDSVLTKITIGTDANPSIYNVTYPNANRIKFKRNNNPNFTLIHKDGGRILWLAWSQSDSWGTVSDTLHYSYLNNQLNATFTTHGGSNHHSIGFIGDLLTSFSRAGTNFSIAYLESPENELVNTNVLNNLVLALYGGFGSPFYKDYQVFASMVSHTGKTTDRLISLMNIGGEIVKFTYERDGMGRISRMNILNAENVVLYFYLFEY